MAIHASKLISCAVLTLHHSFHFYSAQSVRRCNEQPKAALCPNSCWRVSISYVDALSVTSVSVTVEKTGFFKNEKHETSPHYLHDPNFLTQFILHFRKIFFLRNSFVELFVSQTLPS